MLQALAGFVCLMIGLGIVVGAIGLLKKAGWNFPKAMRLLAERMRPRVYFGKAYLMSRGEAAFFRVLDEAVGDEYYIMSKVRLSDMVEVRAKGKEWGRAFNTICRKHADFVLLDKRDLRIRLVIELDDRSHLAARRGVRGMRLWRRFIGRRNWR